MEIFRQGEDHSTTSRFPVGKKFANQLHFKMYSMTSSGIMHVLQFVGFKVNEAEHYCLHVDTTSKAPFTKGQNEVTYLFLVPLIKNFTMLKKQGVRFKLLQTGILAI